MNQKNPFLTERFSRAEFQKPRHSPALAKLLAGYFNPIEPIYDFGCGDGYYLRAIKKAGDPLRTVLGLEGAEVDRKICLHNNIRFPVDVAKPNIFGRPGGVICVEVAEHIHADRLPGLITNLDTHCHRRLVLTWAVRGQGGLRHVSCRDEWEVLEMIEPLGFRYARNRSEAWRREAGKDLWWFNKSIYIFERP